MTREVESTVFIAKVKMLNKSVLATVVRCFFLIDGGQTFLYPIIVNINKNLLQIVVFAITD